MLPHAVVMMRITPKPRAVLGTIEKVINNLHYDRVVKVRNAQVNSKVNHFKIFLVVGQKVVA